MGLEQEAVERKINSNSTSNCLQCRLQGSYVNLQRARRSHVFDCAVRCTLLPVSARWTASSCCWRQGAMSTCRTRKVRTMLVGVQVNGRGSA